MVATATALHDHWSATVTAVNLQPRHLPIAAQQGACARQATVLARAIPANQGTWCCDLGHFFPRSRSSNRAWRALPSSISCQLGNATELGGSPERSSLQIDKVSANDRLQGWPRGPVLAALPATRGRAGGLGPGNAAIERVCRGPRAALTRSELPDGFRRGLATRPLLPRKVTISAYRVLVRLAVIELSGRNHSALRIGAAGGLFGRLMALNSMDPRLASSAESAGCAFRR
jgi:hypothetical protein